MMNILIISDYDRSAMGYHLARVVREHTSHDARAVSFEQSWIQYPYEILNPSTDQMQELLEWADVLNIHDEHNPEQYKLPVVMTYHGTWYRRQAEKLNQRDAEQGYVATATTADLVALGPAWLPRSIPDMGHLHKPDPNIFRIIHAPTWRAQKGTDIVITACASLDGVVLELIEHLPNNECLRRKALGHLLVDATGSGPGAKGFGTNALEAWALGMPVISNAPDEVCEQMGHLPFYRARDVGELRAAIIRFRDDPEFYQHWADEGQRYIQEWHSPQIAAQKLVKFCEEAMSTVKISVCMIARNEEKLLPIAIGSLKGQVDEVVILDTGSDDNTVAIARALGARVLEGGDRMNKGACRNQASSAAEGDWVVILDCDERIADPVGLREFLEATDAGAVFVRLAYMDGNNNPTLEYQQMRCWRKGLIEYKYRAHEVPLPPEGKGWPKIAHTDFVWEHRPPSGRTWKSQYTLDRLLMDVEENPGAARPMYYLGRQYMYRSEWYLAIEWLEKYLDTQGKTDRAEAWSCIAKCQGGLNNEHEQICALYMACAEMPERRDWWGALAEIYHAKGQDQIAAGLLKYTLEQPPPTGTYYTHYWFGPHIYDLLARCLWKLRRYEEGRGCSRQALALDPDNQRLKDNLKWFEDKLGSRLAWNASFYDKEWDFIVGHPRGIVLTQARQKPAVPHVIGSVLDLGCGIGVIADMFDDQTYLGVDFSPRAIEWAMENTKNPNAVFLCDDFFQCDLGMGCDTVLLLEVLEHVDDPQAVVDLARQYANKRIVVTVPVNMQLEAHVKARWSQAELETLLGPLAVCEKFSHGKYWLAVHEVNHGDFRKATS